MRKPRGVRVGLAPVRKIDSGIEYTIWGQAPVQALGGVDGNPFYFRARGNGWVLAVSPPGTDPVQARVDAQLAGAADPSLWEVVGSWGAGMFSASWMPHEEADELIVNALYQFRVTHPA